ncbi:MAG: PilZ domain-containing protein [Vicinamibacterales bacterium]
MTTRERRRARRWPLRGDATRVRLRGGQEARAVDIAPGGILLETNLRLRPGTTVDVVVTHADHSARLRGRVVRCHVSRLQASKVSYQGAVQFDEEAPWLALDAGGYPVLAEGSSDHADRGEKLPAR